LVLVFAFAAIAFGQDEEAVMSPLLKQLLVWGPIVTWIATEILGKFVLKKLNKKVLAVLVGILTALTAKAMGDMTVLETLLGCAGLGPITGMLHDKLIEPVLILSKKEVEAEAPKPEAP
jgi:hypothetical protein